MLIWTRPVQLKQGENGDKFLYLFFMVNWCLSYNGITLLQTIFCTCCHKVPREAVYPDIIPSLCLNVSSSIFILTLFWKLPPGLVGIGTCEIPTVGVYQSHY